MSSSQSRRLASRAVYERQLHCPLRQSEDRTDPFLVLLPDIILCCLFVSWLLGRLDQLGLVLLGQRLFLLKLGNLGNSVNSTLYPIVSISLRENVGRNSLGWDEPGL